MPISVGLGTAIAGGLGLLGGVGQGVLGSRSSNHASDAQRRANEEALKYAREQDALKRQQEHDLQVERERRHAAYLQTYYPDLYHNTYPGGYNTAPTVNGRVTNTGTSGDPSQGIPMAGAPPLAPPPAGGGSGMSLGAMMDPGADAPPLTGNTAPPDATAPKSLANLGGWEDWRRYGAEN